MIRKELNWTEHIYFWLQCFTVTNWHLFSLYLIDMTALIKLRNKCHHEASETSFHCGRHDVKTVTPVWLNMCSFRVKPRRSPKTVTSWRKTSFPAAFPCCPGPKCRSLLCFQPPVFTDSTGIKSRSGYDFQRPILCWCHPEALSLCLGTSSSPPVPLWTV